MSREDQREPTAKAPRTRIDDLAPASEELSEEEEAQASGGMVVIRGSWEPVSTRQANTCTLNNDTDYGSD